jgi:DnaJ family protein A protein 2
VQILNVDKKAAQPAIKKAYFALARVEHPDKGGDAEKFKKIQAAYEVLKDPEKREKYDRGGLEALEGGDMPEGADDIFAAMFGGGRRRGGGRSAPGPKKGPDVKHPLKVCLGLIVHIA